MHLAQVDIRNTFFQTNPGGTGFMDPSDLINVVLRNAIVFAGVLLLLLIIYAGYQLIVLGGQFNPPATVAKAKALVTWGLIGFLLVVTAYFILQIVSYIVGANLMNAPIA